MRAVLAGLMLVGCASASSPDNTTVTIGGPDAGGLKRIDAPPGENPEAGLPQVDAFVPMIDAAPGMATKTVSGTNTDTVVQNNSPACTSSSGGTRASTYYRVFDLAAMGITTDFVVSSVSFAVEDCYSTAGNGTVVAVRVGTYDGTQYGQTLLSGPITNLASNNTVQVPQLDMTAGTVDAPIAATIPAGKKLIVEIDVPDGSGVFEFFMGSNGQGQTAPAYITAPACSITTPTDPGTLTNPASAVDMIIKATGTYQL